MVAPCSADLAPQAHSTSKLKVKKTNNTRKYLESIHKIHIYIFRSNNKKKTLSGQTKNSFELWKSRILENLVWTIYSWQQLLNSRSPLTGHCMTTWSAFNDEYSVGSTCMRFSCNWNYNENPLTLPPNACDGIKFCFYCYIFAIVYFHFLFLFFRFTRRINFAVFPLCWRLWLCILPRLTKLENGVRHSAFMRVGRMGPKGAKRARVQRWRTKWSQINGSFTYVYSIHENIQTAKKTERITAHSYVRSLKSTPFTHLCIHACMHGYTMEAPEWAHNKHRQSGYATWSYIILHHWCHNIG